MAMIVSKLPEETWMDGVGKGQWDLGGWLGVPDEVSGHGDRTSGKMPIIWNSSSKVTDPQKWIVKTVRAVQPHCRLAVVKMLLVLVLGSICSVAIAITRMWNIQSIETQTFRMGMKCWSKLGWALSAYHLRTEQLTVVKGATIWRKVNSNCSDEISSKEVSSSEPGSGANLLSFNQKTKPVMPLAGVRVNRKLATVLLDSGSDKTYLTEEFVRRVISNIWWQVSQF